MDDTISRRAVLKLLSTIPPEEAMTKAMLIQSVKQMDAAQPEIIQCKDCKHNPKESWFGCPMSHLSEEQRPGTAWCWRAERREDDHEAG